jgi:lauroyl/myristoyl acyltransferase
LYIRAAMAESMGGGARARRKWVRHGLSNALVYGGLHYGARWLPRPVLQGISLAGNAIAIAILRRTVEDIAENFRLALGLGRADSMRMARRLFFEYGDATIDTWRLRSEAFIPRITSFEEDRRVLRESRDGEKGFLLVTGHVGNWEMGAVTLRRHGIVPAVVGQPELDPAVQQMRHELRERLGVESIDIGSSMATALRIRKAVDAGRAVALLADRSYPEDRIVVPFFGRPTPFLRSPALLARLCGCRIRPGFFVRNPDGSYQNFWGAPLAPEPSRSAEDDAARMMGSVAAELEKVVRARPAQWFNFYRYWGDEAGRAHLP